MPQIQPETQSSRVGPFQIVVYAFGFLGGVASLLAEDRPHILIGTGLAGVAVMLGVAAYTWFKQNKRAARLLAAGAALLGTALAGYAFVLQPFEQPPINTTDGGSLAAASASPQPSAKQRPSPTRQTGPVIQGRVEIGINQGVDLDVPNAQAEFTNKLEPPHDLYITEVTYLIDRDGYVLWFSGDPLKGRESCTRLNESGQERTAQYTLPYTNYCVRTSEGKLATITVESGNLHVYDRLSTVQLVYRVWE